MPLKRMWRVAAILFVVQGPALTTTVETSRERPSPAAGVVGGIVIDSRTGGSVAGATVSLLPRSGHAGATRTSFSVHSGAAGLFRFGQILTGHYTVSVTAPGYLQLVPNSAAAGLVITSGAGVRNLVVNLQPESSIQGRVLDRDGNSAAGCSVRAFAVFPGGIREVSHGRTDTFGRFIVGRLLPGRYALRAETTEPPFDQAPADYPALPLRGGTPLIAVGWGEHVTGILMHFPHDLAYRVRGQVEDRFDTLNSSTEVHLAPFSARRLDLAALACRVALDPARSFRFEGVPSGRYTLRLLHLPSHRTLAKQTVTVGAEDLVGLVLRPEPPISIDGRLAVSGNRRTDLSWARVTFLPVSSSVGSARAVEAISGRDGRFRAQDLEPIAYALLVQAPSGLYVERIQMGGREVSDRYLDLAGGVRGALSIQLRPGAASVTGTVREVGETPALGDRMRVAVLYPVGFTPSGIHLKVSSTAGGEFHFEGMAPGRYRIFVTDRFNPQWFSDPRFVAQLSGAIRTVQIRPSDRHRLELGTIPAAQVAAAARRVGFSWF